MATAVVQQTDKARISRENKQLQDEIPKLPSAVDKFRHTLHILMWLLNLDDEENLPTLWHEWANCSKKQELSVFKYLLDNYAQSDNHFIAKKNTSNYT
jgi:predicted nuclease with TOPRIM domain